MVVGVQKGHPVLNLDHAATAPGSICNSAHCLAMRASALSGTFDIRDLLSRSPWEAVSVHSLAASLLSGQTHSRAGVHLARGQQTGQSCLGQAADVEQAAPRTPVRAYMIATLADPPRLLLRRRTIQER